ncbi:carboxypeptidase-like regulatory domain-containing protein [Actinomadura parmotrematis]|uniref:Carboxypeptidase-like regulatory domain-containing protein n=1 Tax=Actinomadura parmotrematis TaxID=2864039 RepID=A0ABS7FNZ1_9ACTN|nr:carboxypeptidase-like regulatory domain-containing protein [Actinomadura parmotrematis]MBW8482114.1 carboxypeptidase-like regulatory domain-containing protein [Actinomadura parmotrematis]
MKRSLALGLTAVLALPLLSAPAAADPKAAVTIALSSAPAVLDAEHLTSVLTGRVTAGDDAHPVAGTAVHLRGPAGSTVADATTDETGGFTAAYDSHGFAGDVFVATDETDDRYAGGGSSYIGVTPAPVDFTLATDKARYDQGQKAVVSGRLQWRSSTGARDLAGAPLKIEMSQSYCGQPSPVVALKTAADGTYTASFTPTCSVVWFNGATAFAAGQPYEQTTASATVKVRAKANVVLNGTMDPFGKVQLSGWVLPAANSFGDSAADGGKVVLERSWNGTSGWKALKTLSVRDDGFNTTFTTDSSAFYRARFQGDAGIQPGTSPVRKLWRWTTKMSKIKAAPKKLRRNKYTRVTGALYRYSSTKQKKAAPYAGQKVEIIFRFKGKKTWYHLAWAKTDKKGRFSRKAKAYGDGYIAVQFLGGKDTWSVGSPNLAGINTYALTATGPGDLAGPRPVTVAPRP